MREARETSTLIRMTPPVQRLTGNSNRLSSDKAIEIVLILSCAVNDVHLLL
jgi:hypothetical protein